MFKRYFNFMPRCTCIYMEMGSKNLKLSPKSSFLQLWNYFTDEVDVDYPCTYWTFIIYLSCIRIKGNAGRASSRKHAYIILTPLNPTFM